MLYQHSLLFQRIIPSAGISRSSSMEGYEISLKTAHPIGWKSGDPEDVHEWLLSVPRAFVVSKTGSNGSIRFSSTENAEHFSIRIRARLGKDSESLKPVPVDQHSHLPRTISILLVNQFAWEIIAKHDACVPETDIEKTISKLEPLGVGFKLRNRDCFGPGGKLCGIQMHLDGWGFSASVTEDIYSQPKLICSAVKEFLNKHTIKRDRLDMAVVKSKGGHSQDE